MPNHRTHLMAGLVCSFTLTALLKYLNYSTMQPISLFFLYTSFSLAGSLFPDIDIKSKIQLMFWPVATACLLLALATRQTNLFMMLAFFVFFISLVAHRTITHRFWFVTLLPLLLAVYLTTFKTQKSIIYYCALYFIIGSYSHIVLDRTMTYLKKKRRRR